MLSIRENPWSSGGQWISRGFKAFRQDFGAWLVFIVCHIGGLIVVSFIPFVGSIATGIAPSIVNGLGMRLMHDRLKSDIPMSFGAIQPELNKTGTELLGLGAINWGLNFVAVMPMLIFGFFGVIFAGLGGVLLEQISGDLTSMPMPVDETAFVSMMLIFFLGFVISLVLLVGVFMATVFAPYLVVLKNIKTIEAIKLSFRAVQKNPWSITSLSLWWFLYALGGVLLCGVGIFLIGPIIQLSIYYAAEDIFDASLEISDGELDLKK